MITTAQALDVDRVSRMMLDKAAREGMVPVAWMWGSDVREAHSAFLDSPMAGIYLKFDPTLKLPDDGRICEYAGLPAYPMIAEGVALRTVREQ